MIVKWHTAFTLRPESLSLDGLRYDVADPQLTDRESFIISVNVKVTRSRNCRHGTESERRYA